MSNGSIILNNLSVRFINNIKTTSINFMIRTADHTYENISEGIRSSGLTYRLKVRTKMKTMTNQNILNHICPLSFLFIPTVKVSLIVFILYVCSLHENDFIIIYSMQAFVSNILFLLPIGTNHRTRFLFTPFYQTYYRNL